MTSGTVHRVVRITGFNAEHVIEEETVMCDVCHRVPFVDDDFNLVLLVRSDGKKMLLCQPHLAQEMASWTSYQYRRPS